MNLAALSATRLRLGYGAKTIVDDFSMDFPRGGFTVIVGPNGCGKSTLLRGLAQIAPPHSGRVSIDGVEVSSLRTKEAARRISLLPQAPVAPGAITVGDLVSRGRSPHQSMLRQWSEEDERVVDEALRQVGMRDHAERLVEELSGGQRQRTWIAMTLAQQAPVLLLDEPTTYLDVAHQLEVLNLCSQLHTAGRTLIAVLHDLNLAARYASFIVAMRDGKVAVAGTPTEVFTPATLRAVFDLDALVIPDPETSRPLVVPRDHRRTAPTSSHLARKEPA